MSRLSFPSDQQAGVVNLADVLDPLSADHSAALRSLIDTNGPGYTYRLPDGFTVKLPLRLNTDTAMPRLRNHVYFEGEGPGSVISISGYGANPGSNYYGISGDVNFAVEDIDGAGFRNLMILGDGPGASQQWTNWQAAAIRLVSSTQRQDNLVFQDVIFKNHNGFPLHADGGDTARHSLIERCQFINCGNGLNYNYPFATVRHCFFTNCEGIENSGAGNVIDGNIFLNIFSTAMSIGGDQSSGANKRAYPGSRIVNNWISGVLGGTGYGTGLGIILAQSDPDNLIANNYIERTYNNGIQTTHDGTGNLGPDDGATILGNHLVSCGNSGAGGGNVAMQINAPNNRVIANRVYNRVSNAADPYPLGTYKSTYALVVNAANCLVAENDLDMSNGGSYAVQISAPATGLRWGTNRLIGGTNGIISLNASAAFDNAALVAQEAYSGAFFSSPLRITGRIFRLTTPGINRTNTLVSAVGMAGFAQTLVNTDPTFTWAVTPNGTEQINGVNAAKTLGVNSAVTLTSDGSNWLAQIHYGTFA